MPRTNAGLQHIPCHVRSSGPGNATVSRTYRVVWTMAGEDKTLDHLVAAKDPLEACLISCAELRVALGPEFRVWRIKAVL